MIKVLFFVETPHRLGGAPRSLLAALGRMRAHDIEPLAVFPGPGMVEEAYRAAGIPTRIVPAPPTLMLFNKAFLALGLADRAVAGVREVLPYNLRIARMIRDEGFDVVHFNTPRGILVAGAGARLARRPVCMHVRGAVDVLSRPLWTASQLLADRIVLVARALESGVGPRFLAKTRVVYNGVVPQPPRDLATCRPALAERLGRPALAASHDPIFVSLSSFTPFKGLHHLLTAAAALRDRGVRAHHVLAGGGDDQRYRAWIERRVRELRLDDDVTVLGFVPDPLALLAGADALVLPTVQQERLEIDGEVLELRCSEGLPRSILESMSLGLPVVATDVAGVKEQVVEGVTGYVVPPSDPVAMADALARVAADPAWRERAGVEARAVALRKFTVDAAAAGLAGILHELAGR